MLSFIKDLFRKKEKEELNFKDIREWFNQKTSHIFEELDKKISETKNNIKAEIETAKQNLEKLKNAQLQNPNITLKEKQFMDGNRDFYIKRVNFFINDIQVPDTKEDIELFITRMHNEVNALGKSTIRPYHILQEFFSHESYAVAQNIKNLDSLFRELKAIISDEKIESVNKIKKDIENLKKKINIKQGLRDSLKENKRKTGLIEKEKSSIEGKISNIKQEDKYKEYLRLKEDKEKIEREIELNRNEIRHFFSVLERSLKKYSKVAVDDTELLNKYLNDPIGTLVKDYKLEIIKILERMKDNILRDKIELKDKKKEKTLKIIEQMDEHYLASFLTDYNNLLVDLRALDEKIDNNNVIEEIEDLQVSLNNGKREIEKIQNNMTSINDEIENIDMDSMKKELKENIEKALNIDLELTF